MVTHPHGSKVYVGNRIFELVHIQDGSMTEELGEVLFAIGKINLAPNQTKDCLTDTLLHEVIHAIDFVYGANGTYLTEDQVVRVTGGLLTVLSDPRNAKFVEFLLEKNKTSSDSRKKP